jgi:hypothetical protein
MGWDGMACSGCRVVAEAGFLIQILNCPINEVTKRSNFDFYFAICLFHREDSIITSDLPKEDIFTRVGFEQEFAYAYPFILKDGRWDKVSIDVVLLFADCDLALLAKVCRVGCRRSSGKCFGN